MAFAGEDTLVLSGRVPPRQQDPSKRSGSEPLVVITNLNGKILKRVELPGDILPTKLQPDSRPPKMDMAFEEAVAGAVMDTGEDKNVYLARPGKTGFIYVISPRGLVLRRMPLRIPSEFLLYGLKAHGDELATVTIQHSDEGDRTQVMRSELQIYTTATGELFTAIYWIQIFRLLWRGSNMEVRSFSWEAPTMQRSRCIQHQPRP